MPLPSIQVPARLAQGFESQALPAADLETLGGLAAGAGLVENAGYFAQLAALRLWEAVPQLVPVGGQALLDVAWSTPDAVRTFERANAGDKLALISEGGFAAIDAMYDALGIVEGVPIIGLVAKVGTTVQRLFWNQWVNAHKTPPPEVGLGYDRESDEFWVREILQTIDTGDLTTVFAPYVADVQQWDQRTVQDLEKGGNNRWGYAAPVGPQTGVGNVPGTTAMTQAYQHTYDWGQYRPSTAQAAANAWQMVLAEDRTRYLVDAQRLQDMWERYWLGVALQGINVPARDSKITATMRWALKPIERMPRGLSGQAAANWLKKKETDGYGVYGVIVDAYPFLAIAKEGYSPNMMGLTQRTLERQLRGRQMQGLSTLLVAYVSRDDPAFRNDPQLRDVLDKNRSILLRHVARWDLDLDRVPDTGYAQALRESMPGQQPVGGLAQAPGNGIGRPKRIAGPGEATGPLPVPPLGFKVPGPLPMIAGTHTLDAAKRQDMLGAAALALLGFFLR